MPTESQTLTNTDPCSTHALTDDQVACLSTCLKLLGHYYKIHMLILCQEEMYSADIAEILDISGAHASNCLSELYRAGFLERHRDDDDVHYYFTTKPHVLPFLKLCFELF